MSGDLALAVGSNGGVVRTMRTSEWGGGGDGEMVWVFLWPQVGAVVGLCSPLPPLPHPLTGRTQVPLATGTLSWDNYLGRCYWSELMCLKS